MRLNAYKLVVLLTLILPGFLSAQGAVNFNQDIAPIIYDNCMVCHREGEVGPMPLTNYDQVSAWGAMIKYVTGIRYMPPWPPERDFSKFVGERGLSEEEIALLAEWVDNGMPEGPGEEAPEPPEFPDGSQVGTPDLVLSFAEAYTHVGDNVDQYQNFVLPTGLTEDKVLKAIELRPGNRAIVHHALFAVDISGQGQALDNETAEYGYVGFGGYGFEPFDNYPGYVPGAKVNVYPTGIGQPMPAGSDLLIQMHYAPVPVDQTDSSTVNIFFADEDEEVDRFVQNYVMLPFLGTLENGPFWIPANTTRRFHGTFTVPYKVSIMAIAPHMHLLGQSWEVYAETPEGDTINLIHIPEWDFNWQGTYFYERFQILEPGTVLHAFAEYDNTTDNPLNPNNPPQFVTWGEATTDEMFYLPFLFLPYEEGDEAYLFGENGTVTGEDSPVFHPAKNKLYPIYPNPSDGQMTIGFTLADNHRISLELLDVNGQLVQTLVDNKRHLRGEHRLEVQAKELPAGVYVLQLRGEGFSLSERVVLIQ